MNKYENYKKVEIPWVRKIPTHWRIERNKNIFKKTKSVVGIQNKTIDLLSLTTKGIRVKSKDQTGGKQPSSYEGYQFVNKDNLVLCLFDLDCSAVFSDVSQYNGMISPAYDVFKVEKQIPQYYKYLFSYLFQDRVYKIYSKSVRYTVNEENFNTLLTLVPPIEEQEHIAKYLDWKIGEIDKLIEIEKKKLDELEELISNKIDRYILKIKNNSSQHIKLRYLYSFQNGISTSKDYKTGKYPFLTYSDVYNNLVIPRKLSGKIDSTPEERKVYSIKKGDLFFTRTSERLEDAGKVSLADKSVSYSVFNGFTIRLRPNNRTVFLDRFILYYLNSNLVRESFIGTLNIVTRVSIKQELLKNIEIPFIPKDEQRKLINHIELMFKNSTKIIELSKNKISYLSELKQSLISEVVTGQIDVRNVKIPERK